MVTSLRWPSLRHATRRPKLSQAQAFVPYFPSSAGQEGSEHSP
jgi:hypothetical protein